MRKEKSEQPDRDTDQNKGNEKREKTSLAVVETLLGSVFPFLLSFLPLACYGLAILVLKNPKPDFSAVIRLVCGALSFYFVLVLCDQKGLWRYHNKAHKERFLAVYLAGLIVFSVSAYHNPVLFFGLPFAVALSLFSGLPQAFGGYFLLLILQYTLEGRDPEAFMVHAMIGCIGILLFSFLDEAFQFGVPLFASLMMQTLLLLGLGFTENRRLTGQDLLFAGLSLLVSFLLLTLTLKFTSAGMLHKTQDAYEELNDPECSLLTQLKEKNLRAYYHAVHTAHFCQMLAEKIGADASLCKAGGYYHKIGRILGENNLKNTMKVAEEYHFPRELSHLIREYGAKNTPLHSREAAILLFSDAMVSSVMFLFDKNRDAKLNYEQITTVVFEKQKESGILDACELTVADLVTIKKCFMEEKLYYDFLR